MFFCIFWLLLIYFNNKKVNEIKEKCTKVLLDLQVTITFAKIIRYKSSKEESIGKMVKVKYYYNTRYIIVWEFLY